LFHFKKKAKDTISNKAWSAMEGDYAYSGALIQNMLRGENIRNRIHEKGYRNRPLTDKQKTGGNQK